MIFGPEYDKKCSDEIRRTISRLNELFVEARDRNIQVDMSIQKNGFTTNLPFDEQHILKITSLRKVTRIDL